MAEQSGAYLTGLPASIPHVQLPLPFAYESTGVETFFRDERDPEPRSRRVFAFHRPETLADWAAEPETLRARLRELPPLITEGLWDAQIEAIQNLEQSFADDRPRALIQMATGSGKTFTAVTFVYRLIKFARARRVLFLVDRNNLGRQAFTEFDQYVTPDDGRRFTELYNVQRLRSNVLDPVSKVCITTIQRLYSMLSGEAEFDAEAEERSLWGRERELDQEAPKLVRYNPDLPIEYFDFIITDECHRSIYNLWRQVLEYFRRDPHRPDGHALQADAGLLQPEPGDGVLARAGGGRRRQRRRRGLPHPHPDHRAGQPGGGGLLRGQARPAHPPACAGSSWTRTWNTAPTSSTATWSRRARSGP